MGDLPTTPSADPNPFNNDPPRALALALALLGVLVGVRVALGIMVINRGGLKVGSGVEEGEEEVDDFSDARASLVSLDPPRLRLDPCPGPCPVSLSPCLSADRWEVNLPFDMAVGVYGRGRGVVSNTRVNEVHRVSTTVSKLFTTDDDDDDDDDDDEGVGRCCC